MPFFLAPFIIALFVLSAAEAKETYRFSVVRTEKSAQMAKGYEPFLEYLSQQTGLKFEFVHTDSHDELIEKLEKGEIDIGHLGPQPYVILKERCPDVVLAALFLDENRDRQYHCSLAVKNESPIQTLKQIANTRLMSTQRHSTCGWLYPIGAFQEAGVDPKTVKISFAGTHVDAVMALMLGEAEVAAARSDIVDRYGHLGIRHLSAGGPYPNFVMVLSRKTLSETDQKAITTALLALDPKDAPRRAGWHPYLRYGAVAVKDDEFKTVRDEMRRIGELP